MTQIDRNPNIKPRAAALSCDARPCTNAGKNCFYQPFQSVFCGLQPSLDNMFPERPDFPRGAASRRKSSTFPPIILFANPPQSYLNIIFHNLAHSRRMRGFLLITLCG
ncbi:hypothetical protein [Burkholderia stagnalis]|uniref:hypothetical protein n=1 Tax=Burkholderia stagnalis TaxID=1503054 RepID=UPI0012DA48FA|nr:hypothetical protein [Burkholderia stagnalis]